MIEGSKHHTIDLLDWQVLRYEPFACDRDSNVRILADRMVIARKPHICQHCFGTTQPGERVRRRSEVDRDEGRTMAFYFCAECCEAMRTLSTEGDDGPLDSRFMLNGRPETAEGRAADRRPGDFSPAPSGGPAAREDTR